MIIFPPIRPPDYLYDFSTGYVDGILHGQNGWTDGNNVYESGRVGISDGKLVCVPTQYEYYAQAWRTDITLDDVVMRAEFGPYPGTSVGNNARSVFFRNQGNGVTYAVNLSFGGFKDEAILSIAYKGNWWGFTYLPGDFAIPGSQLRNGCYLYAKMEGSWITATVTSLTGEILGSHAREHITLKSGYIGLYHNAALDNLQAMPLMSIAVWDPANEPPLGDRDTASTPYKMSNDGVCYFRYPDGEFQINGVPQTLPWEQT